jgi:hypothetical protein
MDYDTVAYLEERIDSLVTVVGDLNVQMTSFIDALNNLGIDIVPPLFLSAELGTFADDTLLVLMDTTDIQQDSLPSIAAFNLTENSITFGLDTVLINQDSIFIVLDSVGVYGSTYLLDYTASLATVGEGNKLQDSIGNKVVNWVNKAVTNNIAEPPPPSMISNGTFDSETDWSIVNAVTITGGVATWTGQGSISQAQGDMNIGMQVSSTYTLTFTATITGGSAWWLVPRNSNASIEYHDPASVQIQNGANSVTLTTPVEIDGGGLQLYINTDATSIVIDNISLIEN